MTRLRILLLVAFAAGCRSSEPPRAEPLSVLLIVMDTVRADHIGSYGYARPTTPVLDALARDGVVFENVIAPAATTPPSIGAMFTGVLPSRHGVRAIEAIAPGELDSALPTLAEQLRDRGFTTAGFVSSVTASSRYGFARGFARYEERAVVERGQISAADVNAALVPWLERQPATGRFFAFVHYFDVHDPELRPERRYFNAFVEPGQDELARHIARYDGELLYLDAQIGAVLEALERTGLAETTVVVVTADHGEGLGQHGHMAHGLLYQEQIHVPFLVRGPGLRRGARVAERLSQLHLAPSVLDLAGVPEAERPTHYAGRSLRPWLESERGPRDELILAESHNVLLRREGPESERGEVYAALLGPWKYVFYPRAPRGELYDLSSDPGELTDLASGQPARAAELHGILERVGIMRPLGDSNPELSPERLEQLRGLGYVN